MLSIGWLVAAVVVAILLTTWITFTVTRLDRLHARVDAAQAALDAQLVRRAAALLHMAEAPGCTLPPALAADMSVAAHGALLMEPEDRRAAENLVGRAMSDLSAHRDELPHEAAVELHEAATRVVIARRFFNDAVRDTRTLRARRMPRLLHLAGHRDLPQYFDIDDSTLFDSMFTGGPAGTPATPPQPTPQPNAPQPNAPQPNAPQPDTPHSEPAPHEPRIPPMPAAEPVAPPATDSSTA